jgi:hypothetical protein
MGDPLTNILGTADKAMDFADDSFESREENEATRTQRLQIDTTSPYKLPHLIRPILAIWAAVNETILTTATIFLAFFVEDVDPNATNTVLAALASNTTILTAIVGFYFNSRKAEKINAKKAEVAIEIERMKEKAEIRKDRKDERLERKAKKRALKKESV